MKLEELFNELQAIFYDHKPDDESFLEESPEIAEEIEELENLKPTTDEEFITAIKQLNTFVAEWFPDSVDQEEKDHISSIIQLAEKTTKNTH